MGNGHYKDSFAQGSIHFLTGAVRNWVAIFRKACYSIRNNICDAASCIKWSDYS